MKPSTIIRTIVSEHKEMSDDKLTDLLFSLQAAVAREEKIKHKKELEEKTEKILDESQQPKEALPKAISQKDVDIKISEYERGSEFDIFIRETFLRSLDCIFIAKMPEHEKGNAVYNVLAAAFILSGKCRIGDVGEPTPLKDFTDKELFCGDIVIVSTIDSMGICDNHGLSVVCSDKWISYSDGTHVAKESNIEHFVMGIKNIDFMGKDSEKWIVKRVKSHEDVVAGEHWKDYGFSYVAS